MNEEIIPRHQLVTEHAKADRDSIQVAVTRINKALREAKYLPTNIAVGVFGENARVRNAVVEMMKKAGYPCTLETDQRDGDYYIVG